jgi:hypothetical protein
VTCKFLRVIRFLNAKGALRSSRSMFTSVLHSFVVFNGRQRDLLLSLIAGEIVTDLTLGDI